MSCKLIIYDRDIFHCVNTQTVNNVKKIELNLCEMIDKMNEKEFITLIRCGILWKCRLWKIINLLIWKIEELEIQEQGHLVRMDDGEQMPGNVQQDNQRDSDGPNEPVNFNISFFTQLHNPLNV